jgi:hypothetical protein
MRQVAASPTPCGRSACAAGPATTRTSGRPLGRLVHELLARALDAPLSSTGSSIRTGTPAPRAARPRRGSGAPRPRPGRGPPPQGLGQRALDPRPRHLGDVSLRRLEVHGEGQLHRHEHRAQADREQVIEACPIDVRAALASVPVPEAPQRLRRRGGGPGPRARGDLGAAPRARLPRDRARPGRSARAGPRPARRGGGAGAGPRVAARGGDLPDERVVGRLVDGGRRGPAVGHRRGLVGGPRDVPGRLRRGAVLRARIRRRRRLDRAGPRRRAPGDRGVPGQLVVGALRAEACRGFDADATVPGGSTTSWSSY